MSEVAAVRRQSVNDLLDATVPSYGQDDLGNWYFWHAGTGLLCGLRNHEVVEHEDGTITVTPSILTTGRDENGPKQIHGFLTRGVWRDC